MKAGPLRLNLILVRLTFLCNTAFASATNPARPGVAEANRSPSTYQVSLAPAAGVSNDDSTARLRSCGQVEQTLLDGDITGSKESLGDAPQTKIQTTTTELPGVAPVQSNPSGCIQTLHFNICYYSPAVGQVLCRYSLGVKPYEQLHSTCRLHPGRRRPRISVPAQQASATSLIYLSPLDNSRQAGNPSRKRPFEVADDLKRHENPRFVGTPAHADGTAIPSTNAPAP
jgi:hypothetical protein